MMKLPELKSQLMKKVVQPLYVLTGPEWAIMDVYVKKVASVAGANLMRAESVEAVFTKAQNNSFLSKPTCYVIRDDKDYTQQEQVWQSIMAGKAQGQNIIILVYTNIDKRGKFYKRHESVIVEFPELSTEVLAKYAIKELPLSLSNAEKLVELCDNNYGRLLLECDKLKHLCKANGWAPDDAFQCAVKHGVIHVNPKDAIFEFVDAVCKRHVEQSYKLLQDVIAVGEHPLVIVGVLYNNFRAMLVVRSVGNSSDICKTTGLTPFQVKLAKEKGNEYDVDELLDIVKFVREVERQIKTGQLPAELAPDYILVNIF